MTDWRARLTPKERERRREIAEERRALTREARQIFDRARKRAERS